MSSHEELESTPRARVPAVKTVEDDSRNRELPAGVRVLPNGPAYDFESFRFKGQPKRMLVVGANAGCDIVLDEPTVSARHCLIEMCDQKVLIHDSKSTNKTRVNGAPVVHGELEAGALITLGRVKLVAYSKDGDVKVPILARTLRTFIRVAVALCGGSVRKAAEAIGVPRSTLNDWLQNKFRNRGARAAG